jgi:hypothetical protein
MRFGLLLNTRVCRCHSNISPATGSSSALRGNVETISSGTLAHSE